MSKVNLNEFEGRTPVADLRMLITDFVNDAFNPEDEAAWLRHLKTYDYLLAEIERYQLQDYAIKQAEYMRAQVGDDTWHYAMEVWLYPETHYWEVVDEVALIERYITTNRDAWVKRWGEPSDLVQRRNVPH